ncbi:potassium transporter TrkG [Orrella sp. JC864]|uniref:TrkH family potassium uptake protein n=1 Tax=Orrella sp. JC864 TaxID=3120298 RepID=UPI0012BBFE9A
MGRFFAILHTLGFVMALFASTMLFPLAASLLAADAALDAFVDGFLIALAAGLAMWLGTWRFRRELRPRDGFLLVSLVWVALPALATVPLLIYFGRAGLPLSFTDAYFEAMSGLTTTGATVLSGLQDLPPSINIWRTTLIWVGGMGILVMAVAVLPLLGVGGHQVFRAETPGPMKDERLTPRIASTAKALYAIYFGMSIACLLAYRAVGLSWYEAWAHMSTTMGLGGFSTSDDGFIAFDSPAVEGVAIVFMLLAGINFATHFNALRQRSLGPYGRCPEAVPYLSVVLAGVLVISAYLYWQGVYASPLEALRYGAFNTVSVATTTGYANTDYGQWPLFAPFLMLLLGMFATSAGSTGGGIKMIRAVILVKQVRQQMVAMLHPHAVTPVRIGARSVAPSILVSVLIFLLVYLLLLGLLTALMLLSGQEPLTGFSAVLATFTNIGPGLGAVGPAGNFGVLTDFQTWICTFAMLIGRLELFTVLVLFTPGFWRK